MSTWEERTAYTIAKRREYDAVRRRRRFLRAAPIAFTLTAWVLAVAGWVMLTWGPWTGHSGPAFWYWDPPPPNPIRELGFRLWSMWTPIAFLSTLICIVLYS